MKKLMMSSLFVIMLVFAVFLLFSDSGLNVKTGYFINEPEQVIPEESIPEPELYFCPRENCMERLVYYINASNKSVHCAFYDLDLKEVIDALDKKEEEVDVKVVVDNDNIKGLEEYNFIVFDNQNQLSHNKFCIIDGSVVLTGSFNPTNNDNFKNNNNLIIIKSKYLSINYEAEFSELWGGMFGKGGQNIYPKLFFNGNLYENYFCPDDQCEEHVLDALSEAKESVYFMTFSFTSDKIGELLLQKSEEIDVRGVYDTSQAGSRYSTYHDLKGKANVILDTSKGKLHHKVFIIDGATVVTGSYNPTANGNDKNDENVLIIHDPGIAEMYLEEFNSVFSSP